MDIFPSFDATSFAVSSVPAPIAASSAAGAMYGTLDTKADRPDFWHLTALVSEAVLEVVCVSSLGFIAAKRGLFPQKVQKDVANLNIYFFTPCLIFSKLAAQLTIDKLTELWIIPVILLVQTLLSWLAAEILTRLFKIDKKPQRNFVKAMAVFGNSNSLPLSLVLSLSHTISGLHWDRIPDDNDDEVGARGILYLLVFSQLGQAVRWSWGMNTLLRPVDQYTPRERGEIPRDEEMQDSYKDDDVDSPPPGPEVPSVSRPESSLIDDAPGECSSGESTHNTSTTRGGSESGFRSPEEQVVKTDEVATASGNDEERRANGYVHRRPALLHPHGSGTISRPKSPVLEIAENTTIAISGWRKRVWLNVKNGTSTFISSITGIVSDACRYIFDSLPMPVQKVLASVWRWFALTVTRFMGCLNVPLAAIILSVLVGSIPQLRLFFYTRGTFVNNTVTSAIEQLAGVAVPLILFVLGGNLCKSTLPAENPDDTGYIREKKRMLYCAIISRMLIPLCFMAPFLAVLAKYTPISILDDPIFIIVCFLLTGAPSALQLAQICQVNDVFVPVVSKLLVHSYVVWLFPSTLVLVMLALKVVAWATAD